MEDRRPDLRFLPKESRSQGTGVKRHVQWLCLVALEWRFSSRLRWPGDSWLSGDSASARTGTRGSRSRALRAGEGSKWLAGHATCVASPVWTASRGWKSEPGTPSFHPARSADARLGVTTRRPAASLLPGALRLRAPEGVRWSGADLDRVNRPGLRRQYRPDRAKRGAPVAAEHPGTRRGRSFPVISRRTAGAEKG